MKDSENKNPENNIENTINAVTSLVKAVPIYEDAVQPLAKEAGKALKTVGKTVNMALAPLRGLVWGFERIEEFVQTKVAKKLESTPVENICTPDLSIAGPALESLKYTGHKEKLCDLYANLLASAMDKQTAKTAHPGFVEIIRNMSADEARILEYIYKNDAAPIVDIKKVLSKNAGSVAIRELVSTLGNDSACEHPDLSGSYLINLERLGLVEIPKDSYITKPDAYDRIINDDLIKSIIDNLNATGGTEYKGDFKKYHVRCTVFGKQFYQACVLSRDKT